MPVPVCPECRATVQQVGKFFVCPEHATVEPVYVDGPVAGPLRIFLSYGHDGNEELVRRIKSDLEQRGHTVWFDKSEIKFGDDWRRSITEGITGSHKFVSFLSKHSTRDPGVCLDEIGIAIGRSAAKKGTGPICAKHPPGRSGKLDLSPFSPPELASGSSSATARTPFRPSSFLLRFFRVADDFVIHDERRDHEAKERQQDQCVIGQQAHWLRATHSAEQLFQLFWME